MRKLIELSESELSKKAEFYFSDKYNLTKQELYEDLEEDIKLQKDFLDGKIPPRKIIGTGHKNSRKIAEQYLEEKIQLTKYLIENFDQQNQLTESQKRHSS